MNKVIVSTLVSLFTVAAFANKTIPAGTYNLDPAHSKVGFEIPHLVISTVEGRFSKFDGTVVIDSKLEKSKVDVNVDVASIDTANKDRDDHLRNADFFDAGKYPKMTFVSKRITGTPEDLKITGTLTIKGKSQEVTLNAKYLGEVKDMQGNPKIAFEATTKIDRQKFGLTWSKMVEAGPAVGDQVTLVLKIQANKAAPKG